MAKHAANDLVYYLVIDELHRDDLAAIRPWQNLKLAYDQKQIWIKDLSYVQVESTEVKCIPYKTLYYESDGKLCLLNSLLPDRKMPSLLWTPIERALPVKLPSFNHNYFGIDQKVILQLVPSEAEHEAEVMITTLNTLEAYITSAPAVRFGPLSWALLNNDKAFIAGTPMLPIDGAVYWRRGHFIIPAGYEFELDMLCDTMNDLLNPHNDSWIVWHSNNTYALIAKEDMQPLSLGSFRATIQIMQPAPDL
jgi:hypothetical protein